MSSLPDGGRVREGGQFLTLLAATVSVTLGSLPIFLVGAMAVFIREEMGFGESGLGAAASLYYLSSALSNPPGGWLSERLGARRAMALAALFTLASTGGIALLARGWATLAAFLVVGGVANGIALPASSLALARGISTRRQGIAFGVKQSAGPYATLLAGASVPLIALSVGWRWAFVLAAMVCLPLVWMGRRAAGATAVASGTRADVASGPLRVLAIAAFCAVTATSSLGAFYVESAVRGGIRPGLAGTLLAIGSGVGVLARVGWGHVGDRRRDDHFTILAGSLAVGSLGYALLAWVSTPVPLLASTMLVFAAGWGWPGLLNYAVVLRSHRAPAIATGILGLGTFGGGIVGPLGFGLVVERVSFQAAWMLAAGGVLVSSALVLLGGRWLERSAGRLAHAA